MKELQMLYFHTITAVLSESWAPRGLRLPIYIQNPDIGGCLDPEILCKSIHGIVGLN